MGKLEGKSAVVTGGNSGLGRAQAIIMAENGASVVCFGRDPKKMEEVIETIRAAGGKAEPCLGSVTSAEDCERAARLATEKFGKIDILCNTAGIFDAFTPLLEQTEEMWDKIFSSNIKGIFLMTKAVLPNMLANGGGSVINMSSIAGTTGGAGGITYVSTKHAVVGFTRQLCVEYAEKGIRCNAICAGPVMSPILAKIYEDFPYERQKVLETIPSKKVGEAEDIANLTLFLAGDESKWINGSIIAADGGRQALG